MVRKLKEELGLYIKEKDLKLLGSWTWHFPESTITFPTFKLVLKDKLPITLNKEKHIDYKWITAKDYYAMS